MTSKLLIFILLIGILTSQCTQKRTTVNSTADERLETVKDTPGDNISAQPPITELLHVKFETAKDVCEKTGGHLCADHEFCMGPTIKLEETDRCCSINCTTTTQFEFSTKRHCGRNPETGKFNYCYCEPNEKKNKVAVVVAKNGIYDSSLMESQILEYYKAVKEDLSIENVSVKKFDGKTIDELDEFISSIYLNESVGYVILLGDDLPVADVSEESITNHSAIYEKLECVNKDCDIYSCSDVAISFILPPTMYSDIEKTDFTLKILKTYTDYHYNFTTYSNKYQKSVIYIRDPQLLGQEKNGYDLPIFNVSNRDHEKVNSELKNKHIIFKFYVHGSATSIGMGLGNQIYTPLKNYSSFSKEAGTPALFVDAGACQSMEIKKEKLSYCCWPQIFMESGVWAYYSLGGGGDTILRMEKAFSSEKTIGLAIRKTIVSQDFIFGDILAHIK